jgi:hypothetical protein
VTRKRILHAALASVMLIGGTTPVFAQGILDRMKEDTERRAENKAVRDAENPPPAKATANTTPTPQPSATTPAEPASTVAPATPATPAPAPAQ